MSCFSPLKGFVNLENGGIVFKRSKLAGAAREVACGQCLGCRLDKSSEWAARIVHEASLFDENCFITLTYSDENMPSDGSLNKKHFQDFMKRLRKHFEPRRIRYYQCGEYGDKLERPHYHACCFNLGFRDKRLFKETNGQQLFVSETLEKIWGYGFCTVGELNYQSAAYAARYVTKKVTGARAHDFYLRCDEDGVAFWLVPEYATMSLKPGIGFEWYQKFKSDCFPADDCPVPGKGIVRKVPGYYAKQFEKEDKEGFKVMKGKRKAFMLENIEEYSPERLSQKFRVKKAQFDLLRRGIEE